MQELKHSKSGNGLTDFQIALMDAKISQCNEIELKQVLRLVMLKVGVRAANLPNDEEKAVLIAFIKENYGNHTHTEIKLAFDMAIADKLSIDLSEVNCYENFTCLYFSKIMTAYRAWANNEYKFVESQTKPVALIEFPKQTSEETIEFWRKEWNESKTKNYILFSGFVSVYDLIRENLNFSVEEKKAMVAKVKKDLIESCNNEREEKAMRIKINNREYVTTICKKLAVSIYFDNY